MGPENPQDTEPPKPANWRQRLNAAVGKKPQRRRAGKGGTKLTPEVQARICEAISNGCPLTVAARAGGVSDDSLRTWRKRGLLGEKPFDAFLEAIEKADLECELTLLKIWKDAAATDWRAARELLAQRWPGRWSPKLQLEHSAVDANGNAMPLMVNVVSFKDHLDGRDGAIAAALPAITDGRSEHDSPRRPGLRFAPDSPSMADTAETERDDDWNR